MWAAIISAVSALVFKLFAYFFSGKQQAAGVAQGRAEANAATAGHSATTEAAIAKAEADAPRSNEDALARLREHSA